MGNPLRALAEFNGYSIFEKSMITSWLVVGDANYHCVCVYVFVNKTNTCKYGVFSGN